MTLYFQIWESSSEDEHIFRRSVNDFALMLLLLAIVWDSNLTGVCGGEYRFELVLKKEK